MARSRKPETQTTTAEAGMTMILDTPVEKSIDEAAKLVGVAEIRLLEMFSERLELPEAMGWETVPIEHESLLVEFKQQQDAFNSVRALEPEKTIEAPTEPPIPQAQKPPLVEDEPQSKKGGNSKKNSTALTKRQKEAMEKKEKQAANLSQSVTEVKRTIKRQKGAKAGAELAAIELAAEDMVYHAVKDQALRREIAVHGAEMAEHANFDPIQYLKESGLVGEGELLDDLQTDVSDLLGKYEIATEEIVSNSTLNHFNLEDSEALLNELLNSKESA